MYRFAMGWREIKMREREAKELDLRSHVLGVVLMGIFGAFTAVLFFLGMRAQ